MSYLYDQQSQKTNSHYFFIIKYWYITSQNKAVAMIFIGQYQIQWQEITLYVHGHPF